MGGLLLPWDYPRGALPWTGAIAILALTMAILAGPGLAQDALFVLSLLVGLLSFVIIFRRMDR